MFYSAADLLQSSCRDAAYLLQNHLEMLHTKFEVFNVLQCCRTTADLLQIMMAHYLKLKSLSQIVWPWESYRWLYTNRLPLTPPPSSCDSITYKAKNFLAHACASKLLSTVYGRLSSFVQIVGRQITLARCTWSIQRSRLKWSSSHDWSIQHLC